MVNVFSCNITTIASTNKSLGTNLEGFKICGGDL